VIEPPSGPTEEEPGGTPQRRKLIEVALPLEAINRESAREKSIRHGHPSTLHLWWARRPLAAARAVLFAQLVDDPSARPDRFPKEEDQRRERERLFALIEKMVPWEATRDERIMRQVREEIAKSSEGPIPPILDPFAGGGTIPLEAHRLGLDAHASDLNPIPVLINKALIEIPPRWAGHSPVSPDAEIRADWPGASGLAEDVRCYGRWMRAQAHARIGAHYPPATLEDGTQVPVIAWIWARTVRCPNPACGAEMPLVRSFWLSKNARWPTHVVPKVAMGRITYEIAGDDVDPRPGTVDGKGAECLVCGGVAPLRYVRTEGAAGRMSSALMAVVGEGKRRRVYLAPAPEHVRAAEVEGLIDVPEAELPEQALGFRVQAYGMRRYRDLFTNRQLLALLTFSDLAGEARDRVEADAAGAGMSPFAAAQYSRDVATYLACMVSAVADDLSSLCSWRSSHGTGATRSTFARQALPMVWDYAESNPFAGAAGDLATAASSVSRVIDALPVALPGSALQANARDVDLSLRPVVSTDPPYYDNIGYADLSDFFYVWLRRSLADIYPDVMNTILTPKEPELIATPYRHGGSRAKAEHHFERGFVETFRRIREGHHPDYPLALFYAFKQSETDDIDGTASTGWETLLSGLIEAGWTVTATWPVRTERSGRSRDIGSNALATSIVLACRPRPATAATTDRRGFLRALRKELPTALRELQQGSVAPVDMAQSAIGPGIAIFSRFAKVTESDGMPMRVRRALTLINDVLAEVLAEQEGEFDMETRWCVKWFEQFQWERGRFGDAETLSKAYNTSVRGLEEAGVTASGDSRVWLLKPSELPEAYDPLTDRRLSAWEAAMHLSRILEGTGRVSGVDAAGELLHRFRLRGGVDEDSVKDLAYLLYHVCERRGWAESGRRFNNLVGSWPDLQTAARAAQKRNDGPGDGTVQLSWESIAGDDDDE
jgi:putative DNA methylase